MTTAVSKLVATDETLLLLLQLLLLMLLMHFDSEVHATESWSSDFDDAIVTDRGLNMFTFFDPVCNDDDDDDDDDDDNDDDDDSAFFCANISFDVALSLSSASSCLSLYISRLTQACALSVSLRSKSIPIISLSPILKKGLYYYIAINKCEN